MVCLFYLLKEPAFSFVDFCYGLFCCFCILFDENALQFMHYETLWYAMNSLAARLEYYVTAD